ncbi:MAG: protein kinase domain-containing protein [Planctomycetota bacterium]|jgi:serine/threonine protein kinase
MAEETPLDPDSTPTLGPTEARPESAVPLSQREELGPYIILDQIGRGGMAEILLVEDPAFDREVALKVALPECQKDPGLLKRFLNEVKITGQLDHPSIPPAHDAGVDPTGLHFFTMKRVKGQSLAHLIRKLQDGHKKTVQEFSLPRLLRVFLKVCEGVAFAHDREVVHRDLKPENIMVGHFGQVFVMDWGLAKVLGKGEPEGPRDSEVQKAKPASHDPLLSSDGTVLGTPAYMSPEQADGRLEIVDTLSDIYSLGAILYEILTLEMPVEGLTSGEVLYMVVEGKIRRPRVRTPEREIPKELESICLKAMAKERGKRYRTVPALIEDIHAYLDRRPVSAYRYGRVDRLLLWIQRHPTFSLVGSVTTILLVIGLSLTAMLLEKNRMANLERALAEARAVKAEEAVTGQQEAENILLMLTETRPGEGYWKAARSIIDRALQASPGYWKPYLALAKLQADFGKHEEAEKNFFKANETFQAQFGKESQEIWFEIGMYYGLPDDLGGIHQGKKALQYFQKAYDAGPDTVFGKLARTISLVIESYNDLGGTGEKIAEAVRLSNELTENEVARNMDATWLVRGWIFGASTFFTFQKSPLMKVADFRKARDSLARVVDRDRVDIGILNFYANLQGRLGEYESAISHLSRCIASRKWAALYNNRGSSYARLGQDARQPRDRLQAPRRGHAKAGRRSPARLRQGHRGIPGSVAPPSGQSRDLCEIRGGP